MNLVEYIFRAARAHGGWEHTAILFEQQRISYAALFGQVQRCVGLSGRAKSQEQR